MVSRETQGTEVYVKELMLDELIVQHYGHTQEENHRPDESYDEKHPFSAAEDVGLYGVYDCDIPENT